MITCSCKGIILELGEMDYSDGSELCRCACSGGRMSVKEIIKKYLEDNKFDGLCGDGCGCVNSDDPLLSTLMICDSNACGCVPGYKKMCDKCEDKPECEIREDDDQEYCIRSYK